jgi:hypothetical protein
MRQVMARRSRQALALQIVDLDGRDPRFVERLRVKRPAAIETGGAMQDQYRWQPTGFRIRNSQLARYCRTRLERVDQSEGHSLDRYLRLCVGDAHKASG